MYMDYWLIDDLKTLWDMNLLYIIIYIRCDFCVISYLPWKIYASPIYLDQPMLGSYTFSQQATIDHHRFSMYSGYYTAFLLLRENILCNVDTITVCDINYTRCSCTTYVMIYKLLVEWAHNQNTVHIGT